MYAKKAVNEKIASYRGNSRGFTNEHSPQGGAFSGDLLDQKSKSRLFPGAGAVLTNCRKVHRLDTYTQVAMENHVNFYL